MKKNDIRMLAVWAIALVLYNLLAFVIRFEHNAVFWISWGFSLAGFALLFAAWYVSDFQGRDLRSRFYGFPIMRIGLVYCGAQALLGLIVMSIAVVPVRWAVVLYSVVLAAAGIGFILADAVKETVEVREQRQKQEISAMRSLQARASALTAGAQGESLADLRKLSESLRYSDPVSSELTAETERQLQELLRELETAVSGNDAASVQALCRRVEAVLAERNRLCRLAK